MTPSNYRAFVKDGWLWLEVTTYHDRGEYYDTYRLILLAELMTALDGAEY